MLSLAGAGSAIDGAAPARSPARRARRSRRRWSGSRRFKGWVRRGVPTQGCGLRARRARRSGSDRVALRARRARRSVQGRRRGHRPSHRGSAHAAGGRVAPRGARARLAGEARARPGRAAHAGVRGSQRWQVRMYAARAAAAMDDIATLTRLALDDEDNVREATLAPLRRLQAAASDDAFVAALRRPDYQLLRTAARELKGSGAVAGPRERAGRGARHGSPPRRRRRRAIRGWRSSNGSASSAPPRTAPRSGRCCATSIRSSRLPLPRCCARWTGEDVVVDPQLLPRGAAPDRAPSSPTTSRRS